MKKKVLLACSGEGFGHVKPLEAVASQLKGAKLKFVTFGPAFHYLKSKGFDVVETVPDYITSLKGGGVDLRESTSLPKFLQRALKAIEKENKVFQDFKPDLVYSDGKISTALLGIAYNVPVFFAGNQLSTQELLPSGLGRSLIKTITSLLLAALKFKDVTFLVRDFPPPRDVSRGLIGPELAKRVKYVGPVITWPSVQPSRKHSKRVICYANRTPFGKKLMAEMFNAGKELDAEFTAWGPSIKGKSPHWKAFKGFASDGQRRKEYERAAAYVGMAGHSSIMDCLCFGIPMILTYPRNHLEQEANAGNVERLGAGIDLGANPSAADIRNALRRILSDHSYKENALKFARLYKEFNGARNAARLVKARLEVLK